MIFTFYVSFQNHKEEKSKVEEEGLLEGRCRGRDVFLNFRHVFFKGKTRGGGAGWRGRGVFLNF